MRQELLEEAKELEREKMILDAEKGKKAALQQDSQDNTESEEQAISTTGQGHKPQSKADKLDSSITDGARYLLLSLKNTFGSDEPSESRSSKNSSDNSSKKDGQCYL